MSNQIAKDKEFTCCMCGQTFLSDWTDEEAAEELKQRFGEDKGPQHEVCCDDCYQKIMAETLN